MKGFMYGYVIITLTIFVNVIFNRASWDALFICASIMYCGLMICSVMREEKR